MNDGTSRWAEGGAGRRISFAGLGALCVCFFLPMTEFVTPHGFFDGLLSPAAMVAHWFPDYPGAGLVSLFTLFLPFATAFIASALSLLRFAVRNTKTRRFLTATLCLLAILVLLFASVGLLVMLIIDWAKSPDSKEGDAHLFTYVAVMLAAAAAAVAAIIWLRSPGKTPACLSCLGISFVTYFLLLTTGQQRMYGLWGSVVASGLITVGGMWEVIATRARRTGEAHG